MTRLSPVVLVSLLGTALIALYALVALGATAHRPPFGDEAEYLHAGWLTSQGLRIYRDFFEHHAPFLFQLLAALVPEETTTVFPALDLVAYVTRARTVISMLGFIGIGSVAWLAVRVSRWWGALPLVLTALLVPHWTWTRGITDIRNDAPSLMLFWLGAALLLVDWRTPLRAALCAGTGIGLAFAAALWNPKWPFVCFFLGAVYLARLWMWRKAGARELLAAILPALALAALTLAVIASASTLRDYILFTFDYTWRLGEWWKVNEHHHRKFFTDPLGLCPPLFKGPLPIVAALAAVALLFVKTLDRAQRWRIAAVLALAILAALELRFVAPYPNLWSQYFMMWCFSMAALYAVSAGVLVQLLPPRARELAGTAAVLVVMTLFVREFSPRLRRMAEDYNYYYTTAAYMQRELRPGDTVWLGAAKHPVGARDAHYYWFGFAEHVAYMLDAQRSGDAPPYLPRVTEADLPPCKALRGLDASVRFIPAGYDIELLPGLRRCTQELIRSGRALVPMQPFRDFARIERQEPVR